MAVDLINQLLNVFKNPNLLIEYFPNLEDKDNKLVNINYHELLRTFLAIKILYDILIQLQLSDEDDPQHYTIPRLSIYKTYYIICQKLIASYPSASNTRNEQQKLILGQSKLGKLIKLVYPNLLIKRLGSRGESKYNYLGVMWNENIVQHEIKQLCEDHDLNDLGEIFNNDHNNPFATLATSSGNVTTSSSPRRGLGHRRNSSKLKLKSENILGNNPFCSHYIVHLHLVNHTNNSNILNFINNNITITNTLFILKIYQNHHQQLFHNNYQNMKMPFLHPVYLLLN